MSDEELLDDLRRVARGLGQSHLSGSDYRRNGLFGSNTIIRRFGSWKKAVQGAGLAMGGPPWVDEDVLFYNLLAVWLKLGRQPAQRELRAPLSKFSRSMYKTRFGSWHRTLKAFIAWLRRADPAAESGEEPPALRRAAPPPNGVQSTLRSGPGGAKDGHNMDKPAGRVAARRAAKQRRRRFPSLRQRFRVMLRDRFRCRLCGRSPATQPGLHLNIDHIVPWSKGGETTDENLQTLCSDCNQGKFDYHPLKS